MTKYIIKCPTCNSEHDMTEQLTIWRNEFMLELNELVNKMKNEE